MELAGNCSQIRLLERITPKEKGPRSVSGAFFYLSDTADVLGGAQGRNRTADTRIFNPLLYRLSYLGE